MKKRTLIITLYLLLFNTILLTGAQGEPSTITPKTIENWLDSADYYHDAEPQNPSCFTIKLSGMTENMGYTGSMRNIKLPGIFFTCKIIWIAH